MKATILNLPTPGTMVRVNPSTQTLDPNGILAKVVESTIRQTLTRQAEGLLVQLGSGKQFWILFGALEPEETMVDQLLASLDPEPSPA